MPLRHLIVLIVDAHPSAEVSPTWQNQMTERLRRLFEKTSFALIDDGAVSTQRSSRIGLRQIRTTRPWKIHGSIEQCPIHDVRQQGTPPPAKPTSWRHAKADFHGQDGAQTTFHSLFRKWWSQTGSNRRPHACKARALPTELWPQTWLKAAL